MMNVAEYQNLKKKWEEAKAEVARSEGMISEQMKGLKSDFGVDTVADAELKLQELQAEEIELEKQCDQLLAELKEEFGDRLHVG